MFNSKLIEIQRRVYDPLYGFISFPKLIWKFIDTPHFQRLKNIKQLGCTNLVYPSTVHTRFEHSLGVAHLARIYITTLIENHRKNPGLNKEVDKGYLLTKDEDEDERKQNLRNKYIFVVTLAGLLHDIGHCLFSHLFDGHIVRNINGEDWEHEIASLHIIQNLYEFIAKQLRQQKETEHNIAEFRETSRRVKSLIIGKVIESKWRGQNLLTHQFKQNIKLRWRNDFFIQLSERPWEFELISNRLTGLDVDKLDYFRRDSYYVGLKNIHIYQELLMSQSLVLTDPNGVRELGTNHRICFPSKYDELVYDVFYSRYRLFKNVYNHRKNVGIQLMLIQALQTVSNIFEFERICQQVKNNNIDGYLELTDSILEQILHQLGPFELRLRVIPEENRENILRLQQARELLKRVQKRDIYKFVIEYSQQFNEKNIFFLSELKNKIKEIKKTFEEKNNNFVLAISQIGFGIKDKNPLDHLKFYSKKSPSRIKSATQATNLLKPSNIHELYVRVYVKNKQVSEETKRTFTNQLFEALMVYGFKEGEVEIQREQINVQSEMDNLIRQIREVQNHQ